ncbi:tyrosine-type recombinase/integrase [Methylocystis sp. H62]|nr:tyrosine-type recombinase/integrase [Methylocystis sp. H62]
MSNYRSTLVSDLKDWRSALSRIEGAYSDNTLRSYRADMATFEKWCAEARRRTLPASPETVAAYVEHEAERFSAATLKRRLAAVSKVHKLLRLTNPVVDEDVTIAMRRAFRRRSARPQQALGLTSELRDRLIAACPNSLTGKRDRAIMALGYDTLCRRSELVALRVEDLSTSTDGSIQVLIRRSKNDPYGNGRLGYVSPESNAFVQDWLGAARIKTGYIFRSVRSESIAESALHPFTINRILKRTACTAGLPPQIVTRLSGHSMRVGAAQDMIVSGLTILPIMQAGGWKSMNVVSRYVENANLSALLEKARAAIRRKDQAG